MKIKQKQYQSTTTTQDIMWFTPNLGAMSTELCFIQLFTKTTVLICALSCRSIQFLKATHIAVVLSYHQKPSVHTAAEFIHAHSWDLTFLTKPGLSFASNPLTSKA